MIIELKQGIYLLSSVDLAICRSLLNVQNNNYKEDKKYTRNRIILNNLVPVKIKFNINKSNKFLVSTRTGSPYRK